MFIDRYLSESAVVIDDVFIKRDCFMLIKELPERYYYTYKRELRQSEERYSRVICSDCYY